MNLFDNEFHYQLDRWNKNDAGLFLKAGSSAWSDNDGEMDTEVGVSSFLFSNRALSATEVSALSVTNCSLIPPSW